MPPTWLSIPTPSCTLDSQFSHTHLLQDLNSFFSLRSSFVFPAPLDCSTQTINLMRSFPAMPHPHPIHRYSLISTLICHLNPWKEKPHYLLPFQSFVQAVAFLFHNPIKIVPGSSLFWDLVFLDFFQLWQTAPLHWWCTDLSHSAFRVATVSDYVTHYGHHGAL